MKYTLTGLVVGLFVSFSPAYAVWFRSESVEWQTNVCDIVAIAEIMKSSEIELADEATKTSPSRQYWRSQTVACKITKLLKGRHGDSLTLRQDYRRVQNDPPVDDRALRPGDKILVFAVEKPAPPHEKVVFWVNLSKPDIVKAQHAAYTNDCKWLADGESVLKAVQARIDLERKTGKTRQRGLIVDFKATPPQDCYWDFVRTADPDYKATLIKQLHDSRWPDDQATAIYNLISYPGPHTIKLVQPFLTDSSTTEVQRLGGSAATVKVFHVRQAAYMALRLLGANPSKPAGFQPDWHGSLPMAAGFEDRVYFPYGDWQRLED